MTDIIDELFCGRLDLTAYELKDCSDYARARQEIALILEKLTSPETQKSITHLEDAINDLEYITSRAYFSIGFRWGGRMSLSILSEDSSIFNFGG